MRRLSMLAGLAAWALCLAALPCQARDEGKAKDEDAPDITGKYECKGQDADGTEYKGTVEIKKAGDTYAVRWSLPGFGNYSGVGIRTGKVLSVSWVSRVSAGVMVYQIEKGRLVGRWAQLGGKGTVQKETLTGRKKEA